MTGGSLPFLIPESGDPVMAGILLKVFLLAGRLPVWMRSNLFCKVSITLNHNTNKIKMR
jgi:hypothetical protein